MNRRYRQQSSHQHSTMSCSSHFNISNTMQGNSKKIKCSISKRKVQLFTKPKIYLYASTFLILLQQKQKNSFIATAVEESLPVKEYLSPNMIQSRSNKQNKKQRKLQQYEESGNFELDGLFGNGSKSDPSDVTDGIFDDDFYTTFVDDFFANTLTQSPTQKPSNSPTFSPSALPSIEPTENPTQQPSATPTEFPTLKPSSQPTKWPSFKPSNEPSQVPTHLPSSNPSGSPSLEPTITPTESPSTKPSFFPSSTPSASPSNLPSGSPSSIPTTTHSEAPSALPTVTPSLNPTSTPSFHPSSLPTLTPTSSPSDFPSSVPSKNPSKTLPTATPSSQPSISPSNVPSYSPTLSQVPSSTPSSLPSNTPSVLPTENPSSQPTFQPSFIPTLLPSFSPSDEPSFKPSSYPSELPTISPSAKPSPHPSSYPSSLPSLSPTLEPTYSPSSSPSDEPTYVPSFIPTEVPSAMPTTEPTLVPSSSPTDKPSYKPSIVPTTIPSQKPSSFPTILPTISPSDEPSFKPSSYPTESPTISPSAKPSLHPSSYPSSLPSFSPTFEPTYTPSSSPSDEPTYVPSFFPTTIPSISPSEKPSKIPTSTPSNSPLASPSLSPSSSFLPSTTPSMQSKDPTRRPTDLPSFSPTNQPSEIPSESPSTSQMPTSNTRVVLTPFQMNFDLTLQEQESPDIDELKAITTTFLNGYFEQSLPSIYSFDYCVLKIPSSTSDGNQPVQMQGSSLSVLFDSVLYVKDYPLPTVGISDSYRSTAFTGMAKVSYLKFLGRAKDMSLRSVSNVSTKSRPKLIASTKSSADTPGGENASSTLPLTTVITIIIIAALIVIGIGVFTVSYQKYKKHASVREFALTFGNQNLSMSSSQDGSEFSDILEGLPDIAPQPINLNSDETAYERMLLRSQRNRAIVERANFKISEVLSTRGFDNACEKTVQFSIGEDRSFLAPADIVDVGFTNNAVFKSATPKTMGVGYGEFDANSVGSDEGSMFSQYSYIAKPNVKEKKSDRNYTEAKHNPDRRKNEPNPSPKKKTVKKNMSKHSEHNFSRENNQNQISSPVAQQHTRTSSNKNNQPNPSPRYSSLVKVIGNRKKLQKTESPLSPSSQTQTFNVESPNAQSSTINEEEDYTYTITSESQSPTTKNGRTSSEKSSRDESTMLTDDWFISKPTSSSYTL